MRTGELWSSVLWNHSFSKLAPWPLPKPVSWSSCSRSLPALGIVGRILATLLVKKNLNADCLWLKPDTHDREPLQVSASMAPLGLGPSGHQKSHVEGARKSLQWRCWILVEPGTVTWGQGAVFAAIMGLCRVKVWHHQPGNSERKWSNSRLLSPAALTLSNEWVFKELCGFAVEMKLDIIKTIQ